MTHGRRHGASCTTPRPAKTPRAARAGVRRGGARRARLGCLALILPFAAGLAAAQARSDDAPHLVVLAASSLTEVVEAIAPRFPDARVDASFGGSSMLARQIRDGAPADVFLSASGVWIDDLRESHALAGAPVVFARNRLVCIAPEGSRLTAAATTTDGGSTFRRVTGPTELLQHLGKDARIGIADPGVPAGEYARAALEHLGLLDGFERRLVGQKDVRAVLHAVEQGELDAGFVYATDAAVAAVDVLFVFEETTHPPIEYQAATLRHATSPATARRFLSFLESEDVRAVLTGAGFDVP